MLEKRKEAGTLPDKPLVIKTQVTTELISRIAESYGGLVIGDLLVGFKYIGDILAKLEEHGQFRGTIASLDDFILGTARANRFSLGYFGQTAELFGRDGTLLVDLLLRLAQELRTWEDPRAARWAKALQPLEGEIVRLAKGFLPASRWPLRSAKPSSTRCSGAWPSA